MGHTLANAPGKPLGRFARQIRCGQRVRPLGGWVRLAQIATHRRVRSRLSWPWDWGPSPSRRDKPISLVAGPERPVLATAKGPSECGRSLIGFVVLPSNLPVL